MIYESGFEPQKDPILTGMMVATMTVDGAGDPLRTEDPGRPGPIGNFKLKIGTRTVTVLLLQVTSRRSAGCCQWHGIAAVTSFK